MIVDKTLFDVFILGLDPVDLGFELMGNLADHGHFGFHFSFLFKVIRDQSILFSILNIIDNCEYPQCCDHGNNKYFFLIFLNLRYVN